ncbi:MAG: tetratricopeptide repeat protein, partial [Gemmatimonadota bacterium]
MDFLKKLFNPPADDAVDYYREGVELLGAGRYHEALTSFRLALRESPGDAAVLQQIAIAHTRIGMTDEAVKVYRQVLDRDRTAMGAHYGLAFLLLREGRREEAVEHLRREQWLAQLAGAAGSGGPVDGVSRAKLEQAMLAMLAGENTVTENGDGTKTREWYLQDGTTWI